MWKISVMGGLLASLLSTAALACDDGKCPISGLHFEDGWVRAVGPAARTAAVYARIENHSDHEVVLTGVATPVAAQAQFHRSELVDGVMRMRSLADGISVPPHGTFAWQPGGDHIMLMGLTAPLSAGDAVPLSFTLADGQQWKVTARVGQSGGNGDNHHGAHDMQHEKHHLQRHDEKGQGKEGHGKLHHGDDRADDHSQHH